MSNLPGNPAPFAPSQGNPQDWVSFAFDLKNLVQTAMYVTIFTFVVAIIRGAISGNFLFYLVTWVIIIIIALGALVLNYKRSQRISINPSRNEIKIGNDTFSFNQVDLLEIRSTTSNNGFTPNFIIGANGKSSIITLGQGDKKKFLSQEQYNVLRMAIQHFHIPESYQGVNQVKGQTITNTVGKAEAIQTVNLYL